MAQSKNSWLGFAMVAAFLIGLLMLFRHFLGSRNTSTIQETLSEVFKKYGYSDRMVRYWTAIAKVESANLTSSLFTKYNNPFGMSYPTVGKDYGKVTLKDAGQPHDFSVYPSLKDAVEDLVEYLAAFKYEKDYETPDELVQYMKSKAYFGPTAEVYLKAVKSYL